MSRRTFSAASMSGLALAAPVARHGGAAPMAERTFVVLDTRMPNHVQLARAASDAGLRFAATSGDVTTLWRDALRGLWHDQAAIVIGYTLPDVVFCLSQLGRDQGYVVTRDEPFAATAQIASGAALLRRRVELAELPRSDNHGPRAWTMAPRRLLK